MAMVGVLVVMVRMMVYRVGVMVLVLACREGLMEDVCRERVMEVAA